MAYTVSITVVVPKPRYCARKRAATVPEYETALLQDETALGFW